MNKGDVAVLMQLLSTMKQLLAQLEAYAQQKDVEKVEVIKRQLLDLQSKIGRVLV